MDFSQILSCALDIGEQMLVSGAEVYRVEDCIRRICFAYGAVHVDVFTITSSIVVTVQQSDGARLTQTRRIESSQTNLERVDQLNQLSREMCRDQIEPDVSRRRFREIMEKKPYPRWVELLCCFLCAGVFTVFFGGTWRDALIAACIGKPLAFSGYDSLDKEKPTELAVPAGSSYVFKCETEDEAKKLVEVLNLKPLSDLGEKGLGLGICSYVAEPQKFTRESNN